MSLKESILEYGNICLQAEAKDWKEAVRIGCEILEKQGYIEPRYYQAILDQTVALGPFYLLAPGLAMPHARPEDGVKRSGFAVVTLKEPVVFGDPDNDPIDLLITLAAKDAEFHNQVGIVEVVTLLDDDEAVEKLRNAHDMGEILPIFENL